MKANGAYNQHSSGQRRSAERTSNYVSVVAKHIEPLLQRQTSVFVADFGSAQGKNSFPLVNPLIALIRQSKPDIPITVIHEDQQNSDWNTLFTCTNTDTESYKKQYTNVYTLGAGTSFYEQIVAPNTLTFAWSTTAMHWLSGTPVKLSNHYHTLFATGNERSVWQKHAADDWATILQHRYNELVTGGIFLVTLAHKPDDKPNGIEGTADGIYTVLVQLRDSGVLTADDVLNINQASWYRTTAEIQAPIDSTKWKTILFQVEQPSGTGIVHDKSNVKVYAAKVSNAMNAVLHPGFARQVSGTETEKQQKADQIFDALTVYIEQHPQQFGNGSHYVTVILQKQ